MLAEVTLRKGAGGRQACCLQEGDPLTPCSVHCFITSCPAPGNGWGLTGKIAPLGQPWSGSSEAGAPLRPQGLMVPCGPPGRQVEKRKAGWEWPAQALHERFPRSNGAKAFPDRAGIRLSTRSLTHLFIDLASVSEHSVCVRAGTQAWTRPTVCPSELTVWWGETAQYGSSTE